MLSIHPSRLLDVNESYTTKGSQLSSISGSLYPEGCEIWVPWSNSPRYALVHTQIVVDNRERISVLRPGDKRDTETKEKGGRGCSPPAEYFWGRLDMSSTAFVRT